VRAPKAILKGLASVVLIVAALLFLFGGRAIHEFWGVDRLFAEIIGIGLSVGFGIIALVLKNRADSDENDRNQPSP
jgi:hypothetical protein